MTCLYCNGTGSYTDSNRRLVRCFACRGTGEMADTPTPAPSPSKQGRPDA